MSTTTWRKDDGEPPRRSARLLRWYRMRLTVWFREVGNKGNEIDPALIDDLIAWFAERPKFLCWKVYDEYRGANYATGYWSLDLGAMRPALRGAIQEIEAEEQRRAYAGLGPVTEATVDAAIVLLDGKAPLAAEPYAGNLYADGNGPAAMRWYENRNRIHAHWPRDCRTCQQEFRPDFNGAVRCPECRAAARLSRNRA